jgi:hypothetical protein
LQVATLDDRWRKPEIAERAQWESLADGRGRVGDMHEKRAAKVGKVRWDAEELPHSEGVAYKAKRNRNVPAGLTDGVVVSEEGPRQHNLDRSQGSLR